MVRPSRQERIHGVCSMTSTAPKRIRGQATAEMVWPTSAAPFRLMAWTLPAREAVIPPRSTEVATIRARVCGFLVFIVSLIPPL